MLICALADRPVPNAYGIVPFIVRSDENRNLVCGYAHQKEIGDEELGWLYRSSIGAIDVSALDVRLPVCDQTWMAGWIGERFAADCVRVNAPALDVPDDAHAVPGQGRFWIGPPSEICARRHRWVAAAARQAVRMTDPARLADLLRWADPDAPEAEAAIWHACSTDEARQSHLQWCSTAVSSPHARQRTPAALRDQFRRTIHELLQD